MTGFGWQALPHQGSNLCTADPGHQAHVGKPGLVGGSIHELLSPWPCQPKPTSTVAGLRCPEGGCRPFTAPSARQNRGMASSPGHGCERYLVSPWSTRARSHRFPACAGGAITRDAALTWRHIEPDHPAPMMVKGVLVLWKTASLPGHKRLEYRLVRTSKGMSVGCDEPYRLLQL